MRALRTLLLVFALFLALFSPSVQADDTCSVTLAWDPNSEPDLEGYRLYCGVQSGNYIRVLDVGNVTNVTVRDLPVELTNYFVVTAYNTSGLESGPSNEVGYRMPARPKPRSRLRAIP